MKNLLKFLGIIAIVAMVGFTLASCGGTTSPADEPPQPPPPPDTSVWELKIVPNEFTNGLWECVTAGPNDDVGDTVTAYAYGSAGLKYAGGILEGPDSAAIPPFDPTTAATLYIAARVGPAKGVTKVTSKPSYPPVTAIKESAFTGATGLTDVVVVADDTSAYIPAANKKYNLQTIKEDAFSGSTNLANFALPEGLKTIGDNAFKNTALVDLAIPSTVTTIGESAFEGITTLTSISFAADSVLTTIGDSAFKLGGGGGSIISLPASVTTIGDEAFAFAYNGIIALDGAGITTLGQNVLESVTGTLMVSGLGTGVNGLKAVDDMWEVEFTFDDPDNPQSVISVGDDWLCSNRMSPAITTVIFDQVAIPIAKLYTYVLPTP